MHRGLGKVYKQSDIDSSCCKKADKGRFILSLNCESYSSYQNLSLDTATTAFTTKPANPTIVQEGKSFTLEWTYTLDGTLVIAQFFNTSGGGNVIFAKTIGTGNVSVEPDYQGRFSGQVTNTKAELTIVGMQRSELLTCRLALTPTGAGSLIDIVEISILCKYID